MRSFFLIIVGVIALAIFAGCSNLHEKKTNEIIEIEKIRLKALVDADIRTAEQLHADEFQLISPIAFVFTKELYLGQIDSGYLDYKQWDFNDASVRLYKNVALIRYSDTEFCVFENGELACNALLTHTNLYEKHKGRWQIVWSQASGEISAVDDTLDIN